jgi:hypothetical protein
MKFVPKLNIETEINVEILMMVVMKDAVRLPGLPPMSLESNARVVNYAMVISIQQYGHERNPMDSEKKHGRGIDKLKKCKLHWMNCCC